MLRVALLEDDPIQAKAIGHLLTNAGYTCAMFARGGDLLHALGRDTFDLLILDWEIGDVTGKDVLMWARVYLRDPIPVVFCSVRGNESDIVEALGSGADDYMVKPVRASEMLARLGAVMRRAGNRIASRSDIRLGHCRIDLAAGRALVDDREVKLSVREFDLCVSFFRNPEKVLSRSYLMESVWGHREAIATRTLDTHVSKLRKRLDLRPERGCTLDCVYQKGYRLHMCQA